MMLKRLADGMRALPFLMRLGLLIFALGGALDLLYHGAPMAWIGTLEGYLGEGAFLAHVVTLVGMVVTMLGVLLGRARNA